MPKAVRKYRRLNFQLQEVVAERLDDLVEFSCLSMTAELTIMITERHKRFFPHKHRPERVFKEDILSARRKRERDKIRYPCGWRGVMNVNGDRVYAVVVREPDLDSPNFSKLVFLPSPQGWAEGEDRTIPQDDDVPLTQDDFEAYERMTREKNMEASDDIRVPR